MNYVHIRYTFEMMRGSWREVVIDWRGLHVNYIHIRHTYDNMRNVVSKFIGKNEKELNEELVKMSV